MYGLLNAAFKDMVVTYHGQDMWEKVSASAAVDPNDPFHAMQSYGDSVTLGLVNALASETVQPVDTVLDLFGEHWVVYTSHREYSQLFDIAGPSLREFLLSLDLLHVRVANSFTGLVPPQFQFSAMGGTSLRMHYMSKRQGLCPMIPGLLRGLSAKFKTPLNVVEDLCIRKGHTHCEFVIDFPEVSE